MAGQRLPLNVVQARGSKHLTKAEIHERQEREIKPITDNIIAPGYLTKRRFRQNRGSVKETQHHRGNGRRRPGSLYCG